MRRLRLVVLGSAALYLLLAASLFGYTVDDAYISLRYARHLADGQGLVWNPGEAPRVEGYSNLLWVLMMAAFEAAAPARAVLLTKLVGLGCGLACVPLAARVARSFGAGRLGQGATALLLGASPTFAFWAVAGLETPAFCLALLAGVLAFREWPRAYPAVLALAALLRPEGAYLFAVLWLARLAADLFGRDADRRAALRHALRDGVLFALLHAPLIAWRLWYYGQLLPNTVHAKYAPFAGIRYFIVDALGYFPLQLAALVAVVVLPRLGSRARLERLPLLLLPLATAAALVNCRPAMGYYFRFLWPVLPLAFVASGLVLELARQRFGARVAGLALTLLAGYPLFGISTVQATAESQRQILEAAHRRLGEDLAAERVPGRLVALSDCGLIPYLASDVAFVDMWGLNDLGIAREGFDAGALLAREPEAIVLVSSEAERYQPAFAWEAELAASPAFRERYRLRRAYRAPPHRYHLLLYERLPALQ